jgi:hypothetical protein
MLLGPLFWESLFCFGIPCSVLKEPGSDGGIALSVVEELAGGERVSAEGERG